MLLSLSGGKSFFMFYVFGLWKETHEHCTKINLDGGIHVKRLQRKLSIVFTLLLVLSTIFTPLTTFAETTEMVDENEREVSEKVLSEDHSETSVSKEKELEENKKDEKIVETERIQSEEKKDENNPQEKETIHEKQKVTSVSERAPPVTVNVRVETHEKTLVPPTEVTVDNFDLSPYGGPETVDSPRAIHAIIRALETVDDLDLTDRNDFQLGFGGNYIVSIGELAEFSNGPFSGWKYFIDNQFVPVGVLDREIKDGDSIVLYYTVNFNETFTWFERDSYSVEVGEKLEVQLVGDHFGQVSPVKGASILINEEEYEESGKTILTDENGEVELVFDEPGTYHLSANRENSAGERDIVRPYAIVEVTEKQIIDTNPPVITVDGIDDGDIVMESKVSFAVEAIDDVDGEVPATVEVNGELVESENGTYVVDLEEGENIFVIKAQDEAGNETIEKLTVIYQPETEQKETKYDIEESIEKAAQYILSKGVTSEWEAIGLARAGYKVPASYTNILLQHIEREITNGLENGRFIITDAERLAIAAVAIGQDPRDVGGHNLIELIYNSPDRKLWDGSFEDTMTYQGNNGPIFALIALDTKNYPVPENARWTREKLIDELLANQNIDGSWHLSNLYESPSIDITAMALTALSPYKDQLKVRSALEKTVQYLSTIQTETGGFDGGAFVGGITSEATSQVIIGLTAYGIDPTSEQFTKNGNNLIEHLLSYQNEDGGFRHTDAYPASDAMATEQALQALVAYQLFLNGEDRLYHFGTLDDEEDQEPVEEDERDQDPIEEDRDDSDKEDSDGNQEEENQRRNNLERDEDKSLIGKVEGQSNIEEEQFSSNGEQSQDEESSDKKLPTTATNIFNFMLFGIVLLVVGMIVYIIQRRISVSK